MVNYIQLLKEQRNTQHKNNLYYITQLELCYNSSKMAGLNLCEADIRMIYDDNMLFADSKSFSLNSIFEVYNHFNVFDYILDTIDEPITEEYIKTLYKKLKRNTKEELDYTATFGNYRKRNLDTVNFTIIDGKKVQSAMDTFLEEYNYLSSINITDLCNFHFKFGHIHPFADCNGRISRLLLFKECLRYNICPFVILADSKLDYYRGLLNYENDNRILLSHFTQLQNIYENVATKFNTDFEL